MEQTITNESLIEDLKYLSTDKEGNEYRIEAKKGNIDKATRYTYLEMSLLFY